MPLAIGDAVHNLRAALDHVAFALMEAYQATTNPGQPIDTNLIRDSEFPVIGDTNERSGKTGNGEHDFNSVAGRTLKGIDPNARAAIKTLQPYHRGPQFRSDPLWIIHDLDRVDKHRQLSVVATSIQARHFNIGGLGAFPHIWLGGGVVEDGTKVAEWAKPLGPAPDVDLSFEPQITFGEGEPAEEWPVVKTLIWLAAEVRDRVMPSLTGFL